MESSDTTSLAADVTASIEAAASAAIASIRSAADIGNPQLLAVDTIDHVINAAELTGVDFTAAGRGHGASGPMTFTDAADHQTVDVAGNGSFTAGLTDGTIRSSLPAGDGAGHTTTATSVLPDTDKGPSQTSSVNAVNPTHMTPTISGLEGDEFGTVTSTGANGKLSAVISAGATVELASAYSGTISFAGATGTLIIDHSSSFSGTITGQLAIGDVIDLADITGWRECDDRLFGQQLARYADGERWNAYGQHCTHGQLLAGKLYSFQRRSRWDNRRRPAGVACRCNTPSQLTAAQPTYADHGFTNAVSMGWDNPNFFPIGPFDSGYNSQTDVNTWSALGWNTDFADGGVTLSLAASHGISIIEQNLSGELRDQCRRASVTGRTQHIRRRRLYSA